MISDMHGQAWFQKSSFISHVDIAPVVEQKTRVSRFSVHFGLNLRSKEVIVAFQERTLEMYD